MSDRLRESNPLAHPLAIGRDLAIGGVEQAYSFQRGDCKLFGFLSVEAMHQQKRLNEFPARQSAREGIKLSAITKLAKECFRLICRGSQNRDAPATGTQQASHQVH